jgi:hypothetical protein
MALTRHLSSILPFKTLLRLTGRKLLLPFYHVVSNTDLPHIKYLYKVKTEKEFEADLDFILQHFEPVSVEALTQSYGNSQPLKKNSFILSFDDGLREMYDIVCPILKRKGIPAIFFINSAFVDNKDLFFRYKASLLYNSISVNPKVLASLKKEGVSTFSSPENLYKWLFSVTYSNKSLLDELACKIDFKFSDFLEVRKPYLTSEQIKDMVLLGFTFGAHSIDHPYFPVLSSIEQLNQANESMRFVMENFGSQNCYFSFPFFDDGVDASFFQLFYSQTNPYKPRLIFGSSGIKNDELPYVYQRLTMEGMSGNGCDYLYNQYLRYCIKVLFSRNIKRHPDKV